MTLFAHILIIYVIIAVIFKFIYARSKKWTFIETIAGCLIELVFVACIYWVGGAIHYVWINA